MRENTDIEFKRGDKVVVRRSGKHGTVASIGRVSGRVYVRMEPYGIEKNYSASSLRKEAR